MSQRTSEYVRIVPSLILNFCTTILSSDEVQYFQWNMQVV